MMPVCPARAILYMLDAPLDADVRRHRMNPRHVKSRGQADRLRKLGYAVSITP